MNIYALQTARGGSKSVLQKNIQIVKDKPLYLHNILYAKKSKYIKDVYVSTDIELIKNNADEYDYKIIDRPKDLMGDDASHHDTIKHAILCMEKELGEKIDIIVILLGNSIGARTVDLDSAIQMLADCQDLDSVQSVSKYNMYNPFRAFKIENDKLITSIPQNQIKENAVTSNINERAAAGDIYFFNGSFFVIRRDVVFKDDGLLPFTWLGKNIAPFIQDAYMEVDADWQLEYLRKKEF